jgi:hypothetical protein
MTLLVRKHRAFGESPHFISLRQPQNGMSLLNQLLPAYRLHAILPPTYTAPHGFTKTAAKYGDSPMQTALFRLGPIIATPDFLSTVPRPAMVQAIKKHATEPRLISDGQPILTQYLHGDIGFQMVTDADRRFTTIQLNKELAPA